MSSSLRAPCLCVKEQDKEERRWGGKVAYPCTNLDGPSVRREKKKRHNNMRRVKKKKKGGDCTLFTINGDRKNRRSWGYISEGNRRNQPNKKKEEKITMWKEKEGAGTSIDEAAIAASFGVALPPNELTSNKLQSHLTSKRLGTYFFFLS